MVRFNKKESAERRELLSSLNQMNDAKENETENGKSAIFNYVGYPHILARC